MQEVSDAKDNCPICLEPLDNTLCQTECGHQFHSRCILQSVMRSQGCPICRAELCTRPEPTIVDVSSRISEMQEEDEQITRLQRAYDARRRRLESRDELVKAAKERADLLYKEFAGYHTAYETAWDEAIKEVSFAEPITKAKRARKLAMRRMRVASTKYKRLLHANLGDRPVTNREMRQDTLAQAIQRLVRARG